MPARPRVDYVALARFRYRLRQFLRASEEAARAAGLEPQHHQLLLAIKGAPADAVPTVAYLAEQLQIKHHSVVGLLDRLTRKRLVRRTRDSADHRRVIARLETKGEALLHQLGVFHQRELRSLAPELVAAIDAIVGTAAPDGPRPRR